MKISLFWKLGLMSFLPLGLLACNSVSSDSEDEEDDSTFIFNVSSSSEGTITVKSSDAGGGGGSSSAPATEVPTGCDAVTDVLTAPSNFTISKNGDDQWTLLWSYERNESRPESGFIIEMLDTDANSGWEALDSTAAEVTIYNLVGASYAGMYFRVLAKDECGYSKASGMLQVSKSGGSSTPSTTSADIAVPTGLKTENVGKNKWKLSWNYTATAGKPETGFRVETFDLENGTSWEAESKIIPKGVLYYIFDVTSKDPDRLIHVVALADDAVSEYSEGIQIPAYVDYDTPVPVAEVEMSVPADLKLDSIGVGIFQLTWSYNDKKDRPENGFVLQNMAPGDASWSDAGSTSKGVHVFVVDAMANNKKNSGKFYRVAAKDGAGVLSDFSADIQIPLMSDDSTFYTSTDNTPLAVPTNLGLEDLGGNKWRIVWSYENNPSRPETKGFTLQKLNPKDAIPAWQSDAGQTNKGVHFFDITLDQTENANEVFYRVAARDARGLSEYSETITLPKYSPNAPADGCSGGFAVPSGLKSERIAPRVWRIVWSYDQNAKCLEEGFVIQKLNISGGTKVWENIGTTERNVHYYSLEGDSHLDKYYRVAAYRGDDTTVFSNEVLMTRSTPYSSEYPFATPQVKIKYFYDPWGTPRSMEFTMIVTGNYPNHAMLYSAYTQSFQYQFRWNGEDEGEWNTVDVEKDGVYETTYTKTFTDFNELCHSYASARIIWTQVGGEKDYTEWSSPIGPLYDNKGLSFTYDDDIDPSTPDITETFCKE